MKFKIFSFALVVVLVVISTGFLWITYASAGTDIIVNTNTDEYNVDGDCSLREAVNAANTDTAVDACSAGTGADTVHVPAGVFLLTIPGSGESLGLTGDLDIYAPLTILGAGAGSTIIDANFLDRVMDVYGATTLTVTGVTLQNGLVAGTGSVYAGGGIAITSTVTLTMNDSAILNNQAGDGAGGLFNNGGVATLNHVLVSGNDALFAAGIRNTGLLTINNSTISDNQASTYAGGVMSSQSLTLNGSTVSGNSAGTNGGGLYIYLGTGSLTNSTISGNRISGSMGGGVWVYYQADVSIASTTIAANQGGAGLFNYHEGAGGDPQPPNIQIKHTILSGNTPVNCGRTINAPVFGSLGHNLDSGHACGLTSIGDLADTNPLLGPLQNNGGPTFTHGLQTGSPAIDAGDNTACPALDQRGANRPVDGNGDGTATCDMGAYEFNGMPPVNNAPTDISLTNTVVDENQPVDTVIGILTATDPDVGSTFTFSLACGVPGADDDAFNILGTDLRTSAIFDFETKSSYNICVRVADQGGLFFDKNFVVTVNDLVENAAPTDIFLSSTTVDENQPVGMVVGTLSATDPDVGSTFTFSLACGAPGADDSAFNILGTDLRTSVVFDFETKSSYNICVRVADQGGLFFDKNFVVTVNDLVENAAPTDISLSNANVNENQPVDTVVGTLSATDPDVGATFTFSLACGAPGADDDAFNILGTDLRTSAIFDFETKSSYNICVRVADQGGLTYDENFVITVNDLSESVNTPGKVSGGGVIGSGKGGDKVTFGFTIQYDEGDSEPKGYLTYQDHASKLHLKATSFNLLVIEDNHAWLTGAGVVNGRLETEFRIQIEALSQFGQPDTFYIFIPGMNGYEFGGDLAGGNITIHQPRRK